MAVDVDWVSGKISIPRTDMPVVQASPEIRELDVAQFKQDLGTLHASRQGAPYPKLFTHNPEATAGGFTYSRVVSVIPPYFIEFEDGQYAVRSFGANHNLIDVKIQNQVSFLTQNSAGLIRSEAAQIVVATGYVLSGSTNDAINTTLDQVDDFWNGVTFLIEETVGGTKLPAVVLTYTSLNGTIYPAAKLPFVPVVNAQIQLLAGRESR